MFFLYPILATKLSLKEKWEAYLPALRIHTNSSPNTAATSSFLNKETSYEPAPFAASAACCSASSLTS